MEGEVGGLLGGDMGGWEREGGAVSESMTDRRTVTIRADVLDDFTESQFNMTCDTMTVHTHRLTVHAPTVHTHRPTVHSYRRMTGNL